MAWQCSFSRVNKVSFSSPALPPAVCMYKEPSLHELEEKLQKPSRSPTLNNGERERERSQERDQEQQEDCTEQDGS